MAATATEIKSPKVVSHDEWIAARKDSLKKEKEFTRQRDELSRLRRAPESRSAAHQANHTAVS